MKKKFLKFYRRDKSDVILLAFGLLLLGVYSVWRFHQARILSFNLKHYDSVQTERRGTIPVHIKSYPLGVDVKVQETAIVDGVWQISPNSANYLASSARIGEGGNIVIYGHNTNEILGPIRWAKEGEIIELIDAQGKSHSYKATKIVETDPNDLQYVSVQKEETLTVYTCIGFLDARRFVVVAKPI